MKGWCTMKTDIEISTCACCGRSFSDGDGVYYNSDSLGRQRYVRNFHCGICESRMIRPDYVFYDGEASLILYGLPQRNLSSGSYVLEEKCGKLTVHEHRGHTEFGKEMILEYRPLQQYLLLLPEKLQLSLPKLENVVMNEEVYSALNPDTKYIIIDRDWNICGFTSADTLFSEWCAKEKISGRELRCIPATTLPEHYDMSRFGRECRNAVETIDPADLLAYCECRIQGQGAELRKAVYLIWQYLLSIRRGESFQAFNWFLTAPSGCGKTELFRTIRDYFKEHKIPVPVVQIDLSRITEEGFKGMDPSDIVNMILYENEDSTGYAVCFLDEADKKLYPSSNAQGENVNFHIQSGLLTLIEGYVCNTEFDDNSVRFDTGKTMFVFMGAFQDLRSSRQKKACNTHTLGFTAPTLRPEDDSDMFYSPITIDDIIEAGMQPELAGRIQQIVNFGRMSEESMLFLIRSKCSEIEHELNVKIHLTEQAEQELLALSFGDLGVRKPLNKIREIVLNTVSVQFFDEDLSEQSVCVTVEGLDQAKLNVSEPTGRIRIEEQKNISAAS